MLDARIIEKQGQRWMALDCQKRYFSSTIGPMKIIRSKLKRIFDICFSACVLLFGFPLFMLLGLLIWFTSGSYKVFYTHTRVGFKGKPFPCYKFRTMYADADQRLNALLERDARLKREWEETHKLKNDPRITPLGTILRKTSLDELPQFLNVLKGDLSVVGPRPVVKEELVKHFGSKAKKILSIRPGLTGIWQTSGRSKTSYAERIALDEKYVDNPSLRLDLKLIAKTIPKMIFAKDAF